ncbi:MAG: hypothetical protein KBC17_03415 [Candidatus Pacebacteria bacterium]|nr:hypothetical protein [Candidatus Paceibacterota bacterium]
MDQKFLSLDEFFTRKSEKSSLLFADVNGTRCRIGLAIRTVVASENGFVPQADKHVFAVSQKRQADFTVLYVKSYERNVNPELHNGRPVMVDFIEDKGVFYYTIILEVRERPRALAKKNWN